MGLDKDLKDVLVKLIERTPLFVIIIGLLVLIIGAAGGLPIGKTPLLVGDIKWRIALGVVGLLIVIVGILLLLKEKKPSKTNKSFCKIPPEKFFIWLDHPDRPKFDTLFKDAVRICLIAKTAVNVLGGNSRNFKEAARNGCRLQFIFPNPILNKSIYGPDTERYEKNLEITKIALKEIKDIGRERVQVRTISHVPTMAMIIVEHKNPEDNLILVQMYFHRSRLQTDRPMFIIPYKDKWYEVFLDEFYDLWHDGMMWNLFN